HCSWSPSARPRWHLAVIRSTQWQQLRLLSEANRRRHGYRCRTNPPPRVIMPSTRPSLDFGMSVSRLEIKLSRRHSRSGMQAAPKLTIQMSIQGPETSALARGKRRRLKLSTYPPSMVLRFEWKFPGHDQLERDAGPWR